MSQSISHRRGLQRSEVRKAARPHASPALDASAAGRLDLPTIAESTGDTGTDNSSEGDDGSTDGADFHPEKAADFSLAAQNWGAVYAGLIAGEDQEVAYLMSGDGRGLTIAESRGLTYLVKSSMPTDNFLAALLNTPGGYADSISGLTTSFSTRTKINLAEVTYTSGKAAVEIFGGTAAQNITVSPFSDIVHGGGGNDTVLGAGGNDIVWGGVGNDQLAGNEGADQLWGGAGDDLLDGGDDGDFMVGGSGKDTLLGANGADALIAGSGDDSLNGGAGDDRLLGGLGADTLTGGDGADVFTFTQLDFAAAASSAADATHRKKPPPPPAEDTDTSDHVTDFQVGTDKIDLSGFVDDLTIVDAFSHEKNQVTLTDTDDGTNIAIDVDGDGAADLEITVLTGDKAPLTADDFIF